MLIINAVILLCRQQCLSAARRSICQRDHRHDLCTSAASCFILHTWFGYQWLCYVIGFVYPRYQLTKVGRFLVMLPSLLANVFVLLTPLERLGLLDFSSEENVYHRGPSRSC
jgi:hypothetical protein